LRVLKTKWFARFSRRVRIGDETLCEAIKRAESGLIDADLGGNVIKQRVARPGQGRSGGHRVLIAYRRGYRSIFIYGFAKNELDNVADDQFLTVSELAAIWLNIDLGLLEQALMEGRVEEVHCGQNN